MSFEQIYDPSATLRRLNREALSSFLFFKQLNAYLKFLNLSVRAVNIMPELSSLKLFIIKKGMEGWENEKNFDRRDEERSDP